MIYSITGELVYADPNMAAVNVNGIAFQCDISLNTFQHLGSTGSTVTLYTYMNFKQDGVDLLGFYDRSEVDAFKMLTGVSGVGPKAALAILSEMDPAKLTLAIAAGGYLPLPAFCHQLPGGDDSEYHGSRGVRPLPLVPHPGHGTHALPRCIHRL